MLLIYALLPLLAAIGLYAASTKLAAHLYRRTQLAWKHAWVFAWVGFVCNALAGVAMQRLGGIGSIVVAIAVSLGVQTGWGVWYLAAHAHSPQGAPLPRKDRAIIVTFGLGIALMVATTTVFLAMLVGY